MPESDIRGIVSRASDRWNAASIVATLPQWRRSTPLTAQYCRTLMRWSKELIPRFSDQNAYAQSRRPINMIFQGCSAACSKRDSNDLRSGRRSRTPGWIAGVAHELPDVFLRVELGAFRGDCDDRDVGWQRELRHQMPARLVHE